MGYTPHYEQREEMKEHLKKALSICRDLIEWEAGDSDWLDRVYDAIRKAKKEAE